MKLGTFLKGTPAILTHVIRIKDIFKMCYRVCHDTKCATGYDTDVDFKKESRLFLSYF